MKVVSWSDGAGVYTGFEGNNQSEGGNVKVLLRWGCCSTGPLGKGINKLASEDSRIVDIWWIHNTVKY